MPPRADALSPTLPRPPKSHDPALAEFLDLRLALVRIQLAGSAEQLEPAREALRVVGRNANHAVRNTDVRRTDDLFTSVCFAARSHIAEARQILAAASVDAGELTRARRRLYRGLCVVTEALVATATSRAESRQSERPPSPHGQGVLFAEFVTQVAAATRANQRDVAWILEVADAELGIAAAHPHYSRLSADQRNTLRTLRGEMATWSATGRTPEVGYALLNRLVLHVDCMNH
jgi:hypothetical protein